MTSVEIIREGGEIREISWRGHAGYAEAGSDIVCAAISSLTTTCVNALETVAGVQPIVRQDAANAAVHLRLPDGLTGARAHDAQTILRTVLQGLSDLALEYPKHIRILMGGHHHDEVESSVLRS